MSARYEIREQIGRGGLGIVYKAHDTQLDREVAIKRVLLESESGKTVEELTKDLLKEARTLSALRHPNIVTVHDVGQDDEGPFVVMELLEGETLDEWIGRRILAIDEFGELAVQTLEGLIAAQSAGLLHRDLKPPNIMIVSLPSGKFQVKILDFGLAKFSRKPTTQTVDHGDSIFGTIHFMAPEQFERLPLDGRTDLYSIGAIFYYTLTGKFPFTGDNPAEVMSAHISHRFEPLKTVRPEIPDSICEWVEKLMARQMEDRPASAQAALDLWNPVPLIDEKQFRDAASNDPAIAAELFAGFEEEVGGLIDNLNGELKNGLGVVAEETARTIRGTASTLGYLEFISIAGEIEEKAVANPKLCRALSDRFPDALGRLQEALRDFNWADETVTP